jgi:hypothetical protein
VLTLVAHLISEALQILQVKEIIQEKEGIPIDQMRLVYKGKSLLDDKEKFPKMKGELLTLEEADIESGAVVMMVLSLRGGSA